MHSVPVEGPQDEGRAACRHLHRRHPKAFVLRWVRERCCVQSGWVCLTHALDGLDLDAMSLRLALTDPDHSTSICQLPLPLPAGPCSERRVFVVRYVTSEARALRAQTPRTSRGDDRAPDRLS